MILKDAIVVYYTWADATTIIDADIVGDNLHLVVHNIEAATSSDLEIPVGRSFHKIPNTNLVSFIDKSKSIWTVKSIDPKTKKIKQITSLLEKMEDIAWLPNGALLGTKDQILYINKDRKEWLALYTFKTEKLKKLTRIAVSPDGSQLAIVAQQ